MRNQQRVRNFSRMMRVALIGFIVLLGDISALAADASCPNVNVRLSALLMRPPEQNSPETRAELRELLHAQHLRTVEQVRHVKADDNRTVERFLNGMGVQIGELSPDTKHFFNCISHSIRIAVHEAKMVFVRTRPYRLPNNHLSALKKISDQDSFSYPSGHATYGAAVGLVLAEMLPEKRVEIYRRVQDYGYSRLVSGAHFRSDVYAGELAGAAIVASLLGNEAFRSELQKARIDLRKAAGFGP